MQSALLWSHDPRFYETMEKQLRQSAACLTLPEICTLSGTVSTDHEEINNIFCSFYSKPYISGLPRDPSLMEKMSYTDVGATDRFEEPLSTSEIRNNKNINAAGQITRTWWVSRGILKGIFGPPLSDFGRYVNACHLETVLPNWASCHCPGKWW